MVVDYAKSKMPTPPKKKGGKGFLLMIIFVSLSAVFPLIVHKLKSHRQPNFAKKSTPKIVSHKTPPTSDVTTKTTFDFYTLLPKMNMPVPQETDQPLPKASPSVNRTSHHYLLQVASVTNQSDAKRLRDKLAHQGFNAFIQQYPSTNRVWYRVYIGPYQTLSNAEQNQRQLYQMNKLNSLLISANS